jgi:hypothetical protein
MYLRDATRPSLSQQTKRKIWDHESGLEGLLLGCFIHSIFPTATFKLLTDNHVLAICCTCAFILQVTRPLQPPIVHSHSQLLYAPAEFLTIATLHALGDALILPICLPIVRLITARVSRWRPRSKSSGKPSANPDLSRPHGEHPQSWMVAVARSPEASCSPADLHPGTLAMLLLTARRRLEHRYRRYETLPQASRGRPDRCTTPLRWPHSDQTPTAPCTSQRRWVRSNDRRS